jgi:membrane-bound lytic murein transglycosylase D
VVVRLTLAALAAVILVSLPVQDARSQTPLAMAATPVDSTAPVPVPEVLRAVRELHALAWAQRQAGEYEDAAGSAEKGLARITEALAEGPDATLRRELVDLESRLEGLRDAARRDGRSASAARAQGNEADEGVLNAPAVEEITPQINADVNRYIEFFSGAGRSVFERWLKRSGRYMTLFRQVLQQEGLPPDLVHLVFVESGFNVNARSMSAAVGPWQFLRSTARLFGLTVDQWVDERKDPEKSTVAAARYLKHLYSIFGDWPLALASYNAGEGTVLRAIKRQGTTNYWDLRLPRQTEEYVPQFMAVLAIARDPKRYGFDEVELDEPMEFDEVALRGTVDLRALAKLADCTYEELRTLNPAVLRHAARGHEGVTTLRVPPGKGEVLASKLREGAALPAVDLKLKHKVRRGETLSGIATHYGISARELALANGVGRKHPLRRGTVLTIPASLKAPKPEILEGDDPRASTDYVPARKIRTPATLEGSSDPEGRATVTVRRGETLSAIANRYGVSVEDIRRWNHLRTTTVRRGTRLKIRTGEAALANASADSAQIAELKAPPARKGAGRVHVVRSGQTLGSIARQHGTTVRALREANGLRSDRIRAGQRLRLPT